MAAASIGSRRHCEELILAGRVEVDRKVVQTLGTRVDADRQEIRVDGTPLKPMRLAYYLVNKPVGVVSTNFDPSGRPRVIDLLPPTKERLFTVGRLDLSSEGLMLVTNDGELANRLTHPRYGVEKTYHALVAGQPAAEVLESLRQGIHLAEGVARVANVKTKSALKQSTLLEIVLAEGRNREIRRILAKVGHKVLRLKRVAIGPLRLKDLEPGQWRPLRREEIEALRGGRVPRRGGNRAASRPAGKKS
jgi:23S rRNA pseudouridine2605 synthase